MPSLPPTSPAIPRHAARAPGIDAAWSAGRGAGGRGDGCAARAPRWRKRGVFFLSLLLLHATSPHISPERRCRPCRKRRTRRRTRRAGRPAGEGKRGQKKVGEGIGVARGLAAPTAPHSTRLDTRRQAPLPSIPTLAASTAAWCASRGAPRASCTQLTVGGAVADATAVAASSRRAVRDRIVSVEREGFCARGAGVRAQREKESDVSFFRTLSKSFFFCPARQRPPRNTRGGCHAHAHTHACFERPAAPPGVGLSGTRVCMGAWWFRDCLGAGRRPLSASPAMRNETL